VTRRKLRASFGAAFPTFYRLVGPYKSPKAEEIVKTELWDTIKRRGVIGNIFMGVIPMVSNSVKSGIHSRINTNKQAFYALVNLAAYVAEGLWILFAPILGFRLHEEPQRAKAL
jgi:dimethylaniline monooxygenase (N-oxide forming)